MFAKKKIGLRGKRRRKAVILAEPSSLSVEEMYRLHPHKWLLVDNPIHRERDYEIVSGELLGVFDVRADAYKEGGRRKFKHIAVINSIQEEL